MAIQFQMATTPSLGDFPFHNYGVSDIPANTAVSIDPTNVLSLTKAGVGVIVVASAGDPVVGVTQEIIPAGGDGRVRTAGIAQVLCEDTVTAGHFVMADATTGAAVDYTTNHATLGIALTTGADEDYCLVLLSFAPAQT